MTVLTFDAEGGPEAIVLASNPVAVIASGWCACELPIPMALEARHRKVAAFEREERFLVKIARRVLKWCRGTVAKRAIGPEGPLVLIFVTTRTQLCRFQSRTGGGDRMAVLTYQGCMSAGEESTSMGFRVTGGAVRIESKERTAGVAVRTVPGRIGMAGFESKSSFTVMIEAVGVERANVVVTAAVLGVAHCAIVADLTHFSVNSSPGRDSLSDPVVADETVFGHHLISWTVTGVATAILEFSMRQAQGSGRFELGFVLGDDPRRGCGEDHR